MSYIVKTYFGKNGKNFENYFNYIFTDTPNEEDDISHKYDFLNLRKTLAYANEAIVIVFELDVDLPYTEYVIPLLFSINYVFDGYFVLISDYRVYGNTFFYSDENKEAKGYGSVAKFLQICENFVRKNFKNWIILRKSEVYGGIEHNIINHIIKQHNEKMKIEIPLEENNYLPIIGVNDYVNIVKKIIDRRLNHEIINIVDETIDLFILRDIVSEGITIKEKPDLLKYSVNMISCKLNQFYQCEEKLKDYLLPFDVIDKKVLNEGLKTREKIKRRGII